MGSHRTCGPPHGRCWYAIEPLSAKFEMAINSLFDFGECLARLEPPTTVNDWLANVQAAEARLRKLTASGIRGRAGNQSKPLAASLLLHLNLLAARPLRAMRAARAVRRASSSGANGVMGDAGSTAACGQSAPSWCAACALPASTVSKFQALLLA